MHTQLRQARWAETGPSLQLRGVGSPYEKADVLQHVAPSTAANGSKEPIVTDAAVSANVSFCCADALKVRLRQGPQLIWGSLMEA